MTLIRIVEQHNDIVAKLNIRKMKVMIIDRANDHSVSDMLCDFEKVDHFICLGSTVDKNGSSSAEIRRRIILAKEALMKLTAVWDGREITRNTKQRLLGTSVSVLVMYGVEIWTIKEKQEED
ncbi:uncharacterized protein LOC142317672 [Lycorma delicatula]|uniref:uncharacterized protein LOC142317672 n=1 Tax=Lycorma delicatula TaxID=130591 RepID=UPI003F5105C9